MAFKIVTLLFENIAGMENPKNSKDSEVSSQKNDCVSFSLRAYNWFCGFDDSEKGNRKEEELEERLRKITSLEQTTNEKRVLNVFLAILVTSAVFFYLFFSFGSDFGMYH